MPAPNRDGSVVIQPDIGARVAMATALREPRPRPRQPRRS